jgi:hypothetical protein
MELKEKNILIYQIVKLVIVVKIPDIVMPDLIPGQQGIFDRHPETV